MVILNEVSHLKTWDLEESDTFFFKYKMEGGTNLEFYVPIYLYID